MIDLHVHSTASDGSYTPSELVDYGIKKNLSAFALTDHDTCSGIDEAIFYSNSLGSPIKVIPGIELSTRHLGNEVHILGLNVDYKDDVFLSAIKPYVEARSLRNEQMLERFREMNINITKDGLNKRFGTNTVITRAHYAVMMIELGIVPDKETAFSKYLDRGCPCYIERIYMTPFDAVKFIKQANGHPVMAHPVLYKFSDEELDELVSSLQEGGLEGIEAIYPCNKANDEEKYKSLAKKYNLYITGGSDFHGTAKPNLELGTGYDGNISVPDEILEFCIRKK